MKIENYHKPTPKHLKILGDLCLMLIPVVVSQIPTMPVSEDMRYWLTFGFTTGLVVVKFITKLYSSEDK